MAPHALQQTDNSHLGLTVEINAAKSVKVDYASRNHPYSPVKFEDEDIPDQPSAWYFGLHIDRHMWKTALPFDHTYVNVALALEFCVCS